MRYYSCKTRVILVWWSLPAATVFLQQLPDSQAHLTRGSRQLAELEEEVFTFEAALQTHMTDTTADPALMLNFKCGIPGVTTINFTGDVAIVKEPPFRGNIARDFDDDMETSTAPFNNPNFSHNGSISSVAPSHTSSVPARGLTIGFELTKNPHSLTDCQGRDFHSPVYQQSEGSCF